MNEPKETLYQQKISDVVRNMLPFFRAALDRIELDMQNNEYHPETRRAVGEMIASASVTLRLPEGLS